MKSQTSLVAQKTRLNAWAEQIKDCNNRPKGMTIDEWCKNNNLTRANYYWRIRKVREALLEAADVTPTFVELTQPVAEFVPVKTQEISTVTIPKDASLMKNTNEGKKIEPDVDNFQNYCLKRYQTICQIQQFFKEGCSAREIGKRMRISRNTVAKYRTGDSKELSMYGIKQSKMDPYYDFIIECLQKG